MPPVQPPTVAIPRMGPTNQPAKTIGFMASQPDKTFFQPVQNKPNNLQQVISSILPQKLREPGEKEDKKVSDQSIRPQQKFDIPSDPNIKPLRTYEGDVAEVMAHNKASTASIAIAESERQEGESRISNIEPPKKESHVLSKLLIVFISLIVIAAGLFVAYYLYSKSLLYTAQPASSTDSEQKSVPSLVPADTQVVLAVDGLNPTALASHISAEADKSQAPDTIKELILAKGKGVQMTRVGGPEALGLMDITPPDMLTRSITPSWMLGVYADEAGNNDIFVVATTDFFQDAFAGMLSWEGVMADDLKQYLQQGTVKDISNSPAPIISTIPTGAS